jgi:hypothetical protein
MRLLRSDDSGNFSLVEFLGERIPPYAILSHTWGADEEEVTFKDIVKGTGTNKAGYAKIQFCGKQAANDGLHYFWVDTCCIKKSSDSELTEAINSMFRWYQQSAKCYVFLSDVSVDSSDGDDERSRRWKPAFRRSRWFTRGWTVQELIAPSSVEFFSREGQRLGDKHALDQTLYEITGIAIQALQGCPLPHLSVSERMLWTAKRRTKREEDKAYSLLGIFDIHMPLIYGEGQEKALHRLQKEINGSLKDGTLSLNEEQKRKLLNSLRFDQIDARQLTIKNAHTKTCTWLLEMYDYLDWLDASKLSEHHGFLWIKGKPGTGKSTLMKFALANARKTMKDKTAISFFFNARGEDLEKSTLGTYQSLLLQLLEHFPALQRVLDSLHCTSILSSSRKWSVESLKVLLEQAVLSLGESSVICFIDALDECEDSQIRDMTSFLEHVSELAVSAGIKFYICFSSRHYPHITIRKGLSLVLERQDGHSEDITKYIDSELKIGHSKIAEQLRIKVREKASGIFLWVVLVVGILNREYEDGRMHVLQRRLEEIPDDLHETFRNILAVDSRNRDEQALCIQWVLFSEHPLSPEELYFAILSGLGSKTLLKRKSDEITMDVIKRFILSSSKGLTEITKSMTPKVQFIHQSVKDFLVREDTLESVWPGLGQNFRGQSHERLKNSCLNYIDFAHPIYLMDFPKAPSAQKTANFSQSDTDTFPFLSYSMRNVLYHAKVAEASGIAQGEFFQDFHIVNWIDFFDQRQICRNRPCVIGTLTLNHLLVPNSFRQYINRRKRYSIAMRVAFLVAESPFNPQHGAGLTKEDIILLPCDDRDCTADHELSIRQRFQLHHPRTANTEADKQSFFCSLGIILLELYFGQRIEDHPFRKTYPLEAEEAQQLDLMTALEWIHSENDNLGHDYASAVKWCLQVPSKVDQLWRGEIVKNIIGPLARGQRYI